MDENYNTTKEWQGNNLLNEIGAVCREVFREYNLLSPSPDVFAHEIESRLFQRFTDRGWTPEMFEQFKLANTNKKAISAS